MKLARLASAAWLVLAALPAAAEEDERLKAVEREIEAGADRARQLKGQASALDRELARLQADMVAFASEALAYEAEMLALEAQLARLEGEAAEIAARLTARRQQLAGTLATLQRLSLRPPEALILGPSTPLEAIRRAMLLKATVPGIAAQAGTLRAELDRLQELRGDIARRRSGLAAVGARLEIQRAHISPLIARKQELQQATATEHQATAERVAALAHEATDLRELLAGLAKDQASVPLAPAAPDAGAPPAIQQAALTLARPDNIRRFPAERASLTPPAVGKLAAKFGQAGGAWDQGIVIETRPAAQVVALYDGQIKFRGEFRGYGEILIVEHDGGYHTLLAGLGRIDGAVGQWLLAGEPVGAMGPGAGGPPRLYVELRRDGEPINPLPWLAGQ